MMPGFLIHRVAVDHQRELVARYAPARRTGEDTRERVGVEPASVPSRLASATSRLLASVVSRTPRPATSR